MKIQYS